MRRKKEGKQGGSKALPEETSNYRADGSGDEEEYGEDVEWDEEEEISDVNDGSSTDSEQESEEEFVQPPPLKKTKISMKR